MFPSRTQKDDCIGSQTGFCPIPAGRQNQTPFIGCRSCRTGRRQHGKHLLLGERSRSATGGKFVGALQSSETTDQGDARNGNRINHPLLTCASGHSCSECSVIGPHSGKCCEPQSSAARYTCQDRMTDLLPAAPGPVKPRTAPLWPPPRTFGGEHCAEATAGSTVRGAELNLVRRRLGSSPLDKCRPVKHESQSQCAAAVPGH
jgi:hypothetical protein